MARHSKNNTAGSVFTYHEKQLMESGAKTVRLAACSIKPFDACCICISTVTNPVCCREGHLFCKECILTQLLIQKKEKKQQMAKYLEQQAKLEQKKQEQEAQALSEIKAQFEKTNEGLLPTASHLVKSSVTDETKGFASIINEKGEIVYATDVERKQLEMTGFKQRKNHENSSAFNPQNKIASYWIPQLVPTAQDDIISKPESRCMCPEGEHFLSPKHLIKVIFELDKNPDQRKVLFCCPTCKRHLTNATKSVLLAGCGHVICSGCKKSFLNSDKKCPVCSSSIRKKDVVKLQTGGTGFAAHGDKLEAKKDAPSARV